MKRPISVCGLSIVAALVAGACGSDEPSASDPTAPPTDSVSDTTPSTTTGSTSSDTTEDSGGTQLLSANIDRAEPSADAPVDVVVAGSNDAGFELQRRLGADGKNLVISPASLSLAFAMASAGTSDEATLAQLAEVFGFPEGDATHEAMNVLIPELSPDNTGADDTHVDFSVANSGWAAKDIEIGDDFLDTLARYYGAGLYTTDFAGDTEGSRQAINEWVAEATRDRIPELIAEGQLDPGTIYALVNAIYLKAPWTAQFDEGATKPRPFTLADGSTVDVPAMYQGDLTASYSDSKDLTVVTLPYGDGEFAMTVAMPRDLASFVEGLDAAQWATISSGQSIGDVTVQLPKWETDVSASLTEPLNAMGLDIPGGDYSGIADGVIVGDVLQAANITVDEGGTEAAAATVIMMPTGAAPTEEEPHEIVIDRPFVYTIEHVPTGMILFSGHVTNPAAG